MGRKSSKRGRQGIRRKGNRWEVSVRIKGRLHSVTLPLDTSEQDMQAWRKGQRADAPSQPPATGTLGRDAVRYLRTVKHRVSYQTVRGHLLRWVKHFGKARQRQTITALEIDTALSAFLGSLGPTTVRHHRTTFINLWRTLDGAGAVNPALQTKRPADPSPRSRAAPLATIKAVLDHLRPSATRARLMLILTTGLPHKQIMDLTADDWDEKRAILIVRGRAKGKGTAGRLLPLSPAGTDAMKEFNTWNAWGKFSASAMHSAVQRACDALEVPRFRPYDLRHTAGTLLYQLTGDLSTTARMLGHKGTKTAERYTQEAWADIDRAAAQKMGAEIEAKVGRAVGTKVGKRNKIKAKQIQKSAF